MASEMENFENVIPRIVFIDVICAKLNVWRARLMYCLREPRIPPLLSPTAVQ